MQHTGVLKQRQCMLQLSGFSSRVLIVRSLASHLKFVCLLCAFLVTSVVHYWSEGLFT